MKMQKGKRLVGKKTVAAFTNAFETSHRKIRVISTLFVYHPATVVAEELGTIGGVAARTAIWKTIAIITSFYNFYTGSLDFFDIFAYTKINIKYNLDVGRLPCFW